MRNSGKVDAKTRLIQYEKVTHLFRMKIRNIATKCECMLYVDKVAVVEIYSFVANMQMTLWTTSFYVSLPTMMTESCNTFFLHGFDYFVCRMNLDIDIFGLHPRDVVNKLFNRILGSFTIIEAK